MTHAVSIAGPRGHKLAARLELAEGRARATAIFAHCFTCGKESSAAVRVSRALAQHGITCLRFDFSGIGASDHSEGALTFSSNLDDLAAAAAWLTANHAAPSLLIGHSLGGAAVLAAAHRIESVKAVATIGAPADTAHVLHHLGPALETIEREGSATVTLGAHQFIMDRGFVDDTRSQPQLARIAGLKRALLVLHAPRDSVVGIDNASEIFSAAKHPKSFVSLDDADHFLSRKADADYAASVIAGWAERYLPQAPADSGAEMPPPGIVRVRETGLSPFQNKVQSGAHDFLADEPSSVGGGDTGPSPYDLLASALGACISMTLRIYARHKGLPLERIAVDVRHGKIHAQDCADCETKTGKIDRFEIALTLDGALDEGQRARLLEIAGRCPVHRTLHSEVKTAVHLA